jgi:predicted DCC family thiol-disulfide oxidoreductase YuxK
MSTFAATNSGVERTAAGGVGHGVAAQPRFTILIDGACPLCVRESRYMAKLDGGRGLLAIVDIAKPEFDPSRFGKTMDEVMGSIHGVMPDGKVITGVEVFRQAYGAVGRGWMVNWTALPGARWVTDRLYVVFAWIRLRLPGRHDACEGGTCRVPKVR